MRNWTLVAYLGAAMVLSSSGAAFAGGEQCPLVSSSAAPVRQLTNVDISFDLQKTQDDSIGCFRARSCYWGPFPASQSKLPGLKAYASETDGTCWTSYNSPQGKHVFQCKPEFLQSHISDKLEILIKGLFGETRCAAASSTSAWMASLGGAGFLLLPLGSPADQTSICAFIALRLQDFEPFVFVEKGCDQGSVMAGAAGTPLDVLKGGGALVFTTRDKRGAAISLFDQAGALEFSPLEAWGLDSKKANAWTVAILNAAGSDKSLPEQTFISDMPAATAIQKLVLWFAAADAWLEGLAVPGDALDVSRGRLARNWMSRIVLTREKIFQGTLLVPF